MENTEPHYDFESEKHPKRLFLQGTCDDIINKLCKDLGWEKELQESIDKVVTKKDD
jgi:hypothetical protein